MTVDRGANTVQRANCFATFIIFILQVFSIFNTIKFNQCNDYVCGVMG